MTLIDGDKTTDRRSEPELGAHDVIDSGSVKAHATDGIAYRSVDGLRKARVISRDDQIIVHDGSYNKALFGRDGSGNYVVKVAKDGFDVLTASDGDLIFNSANNLFKIVSSGTISISHNHTSANSAKTTTQAHGQNGRPIIMAWANNLVAPGVPGTPSYQMPFLYPAASGANLVISTLLDVHVDGTNITITTWSTNITTITADIKYYIVQETAN